MQSIMYAVPTGGTRTKVARLSHEKVATTSEACSTPKTAADTYIKALMLIDTLLEDGTFSPKQAHTMRWMCLWRQTPVSLLHEAYGTNPELFAIRCKSFSLLYVHPLCLCGQLALNTLPYCPQHTATQCNTRCLACNRPSQRCDGRAF